MSARHTHVPRGQTLVEFALVIPVFILLLFGLLDLGRAVYSNNTLSQAAREGARLAAVEANWVGKSGSDCTAPTCPATTLGLKADVTTAVNHMAVGLGVISSSQVTLTCDSRPSTGPSPDCALNNGTTNIVTVRVTYTYQPMTPILGQLFSSIGLAASASMTIN